MNDAEQQVYGHYYDFYLIRQPLPDHLLSNGTPLFCCSLYNVAVLTSDIYNDLFIASCVLCFLHHEYKLKESRIFSALSNEQHKDIIKLTHSLYYQYELQGQTTVSKQTNQPWKTLWNVHCLNQCSLTLSLQSHTSGFTTHSQLTPIQIKPHYILY